MDTILRQMVAVRHKSNVFLENFEQWMDSLKNQHLRRPIFVERKILKIDTTEFIKKIQARQVDWKVGKGESDNWKNGGKKTKALT